MVICSPTIELGAGWWYYRFQFGHGTPLYLSICVSICVYMHTRDLIIQWRHLSVMASQIIDDLSLCLSGINQSPVDSPHKGVALQRFDVSPNKLPIKHKRDQTQERQVNWHRYSFRWISVRLQYLQCVSRYRYSLWFILSPDSSCPPFPQI